VKCLAVFGGVFGFFMFWQSGNPGLGLLPMHALHGGTDTQNAEHLI